MVPPPTSTNSAPDLANLRPPEHAGDRVRLRDDLDQLEVELRGDGLQRTEMDERGERVEDPDLDVASLEPDRVRQGVAVDRRPDDRGMDEPDVDVRQARLQVIERSASRSASRWTASIRRWSSCSVIG